MVWLRAGLLTLVAAVSYGELAAMMPKAGGQYVYLREAFGKPSAFLYGWTLFTVIQTGTIAAVAVAFARFLGVLVPVISPARLLVDFGTLSLPGIGLLSLSFSTQQAVAAALVVLLTATNLAGIGAGKLVQNAFTFVKIGILLAFVAVGLALGANPQAAIHGPGFWAFSSGGSFLAFLPVIGTAMVGALFAADAWVNVTFTAAEVKNPKRNVPLSLLFGVGLVVLLYLAANVVYIATLPLEGIQHAAEDRVGVASAGVILGGGAKIVMAVAILVSTFGCNNGLILAGARVYYSMSKDGLFFRNVGKLSPKGVPTAALWIQAAWTVLLTLPRTLNPETGIYSNLYGNLLDYIVFAVMLFYILTMIGIFRLRRLRPDAERPYKAWGYPVVTIGYIVCAALICLDLLVSAKTRVNAGMGLLLVLAGLPVYWIWRRQEHVN
jgi:APA family basic amino acid/polyamine antiporter